jgi:hypothetical protein
MNVYADGVHQDYGVNPDEFAWNITAYGGAQYAKMYKDYYDMPEVTGHTNIVFWRTTNMEKPLQFKPLAVCDPTTVDRKDNIPTALVGYASTVNGADTSQGSLRYNPAQKWYYYPEMTNDEVMVFKQFEYFKGVDANEETERTCFHTAFDHPSTPENVEKRQSCEHRITVYWKENPI